MDLTTGSIFRKLIVFTLPILLSNLLQQLYHAAAVMVVGRFADDGGVALAAVGTTGSITTLILNLFLGLSVGTNVICANLFGARDSERLQRTIHTSLIVAAAAGVGVAVFGFFAAEPLLKYVMGVPDEILPSAATYMKIIFLGQPASLLYNFGAGILRAHGDTKRPMYILAVSGLINILFNLLFVVVFHLAAAGVAIATIIANYVSATVILYILGNPHGEFRIHFRKLKFYREEFFPILRLGVPCGLNGIVFSISNVLIASSVNSLGPTVMAANSAAANLDAILYMIISAFYNSVTSFAGQNYGAGQLKRIRKLFWQSVLLLNTVLVFVNSFIYLFPEFFLGLFTDQTEIVKAALPRIMILAGGYLIYSFGEISIGCQRGIGKSTSPTVINFFCICAPRIVWALAVFPFCREYWFLLLCYPISWLLCSAVQSIYFFSTIRKKEREHLLPSDAV